MSPLMADSCCRRFALTVLADTQDLLLIQKMADQIHRINSLGPSLVREFDFHHVSTTKQNKFAEVARLTCNKKNDF